MTIPVVLGPRTYRIEIADSYQHLPQRLTALRLSRHGWVISHRSLLQRYGAQLLTPLRRAGWSLEIVTVPESETSKSIATVARITQQLARRARMRVPVLFAFGGGVVGDLTGFVAAIFRRGVPYIQVPTTLLAQVDSAIGGKVGVDLSEGKNLLGAFYQPRLVWNNTALLRTLPLRQRRSGLAEVIKYGIIDDPTLFRYLERHLKACLMLEPSAVRIMVERSCRIKAHVVAGDERETGTARATLNFGHTLGHALEAATHYRRYTHGEAISIGMCAAADLSVEGGWLKEEQCQRIVRLIEMAGLPTRAVGVSRRAVMQAMRADKKFIHQRPRWVVAERIGKVVVTEAISPTTIQQVVKRSVMDA